MTHVQPRASTGDADAMVSFLHFDQSTLANVTAALEAIRKYIADEILSAAPGQNSLGDLTAAGLKIVNSYLFPPGRPAEGARMLARALTKN